MRTRLPWILLAISVALNVFAVGGFLYAKNQHESRMMDRSPVMAATRDLKLTPAQNEALEKMRADIRKSSSDIRDEMRPLRRELLAEIGKDQPDFAAVDRKIDDLGDVQGKRFKAMVRAVHEFQQTLTAEQRAAFRKAMSEHMTRRMMRSGRRGGDGDAPARPR
ncbi:MAG: Heavy-metal resistance [Alphaproteobacteria bacterium]|jgi:Spy/CpxP family protein refolding chaperone|nr:Heavy-metal resistance [Alphaproteobacteria bacterium]